jgi:hypothetical protein
VKHATPEVLDRLEPLLEALRAIDGIVERKRGNFVRGSRAFLHFHEDPAGLFADVRLGADFSRVRVGTKREQEALVRAVRRAVSTTSGEGAVARGRATPGYEGRVTR